MINNYYVIDVLNQDGKINIIFLNDNEYQDFNFLSSN